MLIEAPIQKKPLQDLEWDQAVITRTRFRMGSGGYGPGKDLEWDQAVMGPEKI